MRAEGLELTRFVILSRAKDPRKAVRSVAQKVTEATETNSDPSGGFPPLSPLPSVQRIGFSEYTEGN